MQQPIALFDLVGALDFRALRKDPGVRKFLSERTFVADKARVELALVTTYANYRLCDPEVVERVAAACAAVTAEEVYEQEDEIRHDIRALVQCIKRSLANNSDHTIVHRGATSYDIIDTAYALMFRRAVRELLITRLKGIAARLMVMALAHAETVQVGRTHRVHAVPITVGHWLAGFVSRLGNCIENLDRLAGELRGKFSGAVGVYSATSLFVPDPRQFERDVLTQLGMEPHEHSTQIAPPERVARLLFEVNLCLGVLADLAEDVCQLHRPEIGEIRLKPSGASSSAMVGKENPEGFENVVGTWKLTLGSMVGVLVNLVSNHQRDLSNSIGMRTYSQTIAWAAYQAARLDRELDSVIVVPERLAQNLHLTGHYTLGEALWNSLAAHGHPDAYNAVKPLVVKAKQTGTPLWQLAEADGALAPYLAQFTEKQRAAIRNHADYLGEAVGVTQQVCNRWQERLGLTA